MVCVMQHMNVKDTKYPKSINSTLIAPCGMNCALCLGHLREKNRCPGCNSADTGKPKYCAVCKIRNCDQMRVRGKKFCIGCAKFPCARLRQLDKRYRTKYGMSMIENLESIRALGLKGFVTRERARWKCPGCGGVVCVHRNNCIYCGRTRS